MFCALVFSATLISFPSPFGFGYINLGDILVIISGIYLSPFFAFISAGFGSCLADFSLSYVTYIPATFIIKGIMSLIASLVFKSLSDKNSSMSKNLRFIILSIICEIIMVVGYYLFESLLYGFIGALSSVLSNLIQGLFAIIILSLVGNVFIKKTKKK